MPPGQDSGQARFTCGIKGYECATVGIGQLAIAIFAKEAYGSDLALQCASGETLMGRYIYYSKR